LHPDKSIVVALRNNECGWSGNPLVAFRQEFFDLPVIVALYCRVLM